MTFPLFTTARGQKFGKTEAGAVWLDPLRTTPFAFYQFWMNTDDADVGQMLRIFTLLSDDDISQIEAEHRDAPHLRLAQRVLAMDVTTRVHSRADAERARRASEIVFDRNTDPHAIGDDVFEMLAANVPSARRPPAGLALAETLQAAFGVSRTQARMLVQQGAITVNGQRIGAEAQRLAADEAVRGRWFLVRKGSHDVAIVEVAG